MEDKEQQPNKKPLTREQVLLLKTMKAREEVNLKPKMNWEIDQLTKNQRAMLIHQMNKKKLEEKKDEDDKN